MLLCHPMTCRSQRMTKCAPSYVFTCKLARLMTRRTPDALMENMAKPAHSKKLTNKNNLREQMDKAWLSLIARDRAAEVP